MVNPLYQRNIITIEREKEALRADSPFGSADAFTEYFMSPQQSRIFFSLEHQIVLYKGVPNKLNLFLSLC